MSDRVDVVVVSYNSRDTLRACLEPLAGVPGITATVVDNASPEPSLGVIADLPVRTIEAGRNGGFGFGCNLGAAAGSAPYVLFLNPDARITPADVRRLADVLDADSGVSLVGPRILEHDGALVPSQRRFQRTGSVWAAALFVHRVITKAAWANEIIREPDAYARAGAAEWVSGACMLVRRDRFEAIGGFDEGFFLYGEDMDLCKRLREAGGEIRFEPAATAQHEGGQSAPRSSLYAVLVDSRIRFARKHARPLDARLQRVGLAVNALTHVAAAALRPAHRRGHAAALRAALPRRAEVRAPATR